MGCGKSALTAQNTKREVLEFEPRVVVPEKGRPTKATKTLLPPGREWEVQYRTCAMEGQNKRSGNRSYVYRLHCQDLTDFHNNEVFDLNPQSGYDFEIFRGELERPDHINLRRLDWRKKDKVCEYAFKRQTFDTGPGLTGKKGFICQKLECLKSFNGWRDKVKISGFKYFFENGKQITDLESKILNMHWDNVISEENEMHKRDESLREVITHLNRMFPDLCKYNTKAHEWTYTGNSYFEAYEKLYGGKPYKCCPVGTMEWRCSQGRLKAKQHFLDGRAWRLDLSDAKTEADPVWEIIPDNDTFPSIKLNLKQIREHITGWHADYGRLAFLWSQQDEGIDSEEIPPQEHGNTSPVGERIAAGAA